MSRGVEIYFPRLWGTEISDAIFCLFDLQIFLWGFCFPYPYADWSWLVFRQHMATLLHVSWA